jgi:hypothetical protein
LFLSYVFCCCRGGWVGCQLLASSSADHFICLAIGHPSVHLEERAFQKSTQELIDRVQKPVLLLPSRGDPDEYRENGFFYVSLKRRFPSSETYDFPNNDHGFIPRSDISIPENKEAVDLALDKILCYFAKY